MSAPDTPQAKVETKVKVAAAVTAALSILVAVLNAVQDSPGLIGFLDPALQALILAVIPPVLVFWAAWQAPHTPRNP